MQIILPAGDLTGPGIHHAICLGSLLKLQVAYSIESQQLMCGKPQVLTL